MLALSFLYFLLLTQKKVTKKRVTWVFRDPLWARSLKKPSRSSSASWRTPHFSAFFYGIFAQWVPRVKPKGLKGRSFL
jgi:hypothetical protein